MIDCRAINKFINTQFVCTYNLFILPFTKAYALQFVDNSCIAQKITHIAQFYLNMNGHQKKFWAYVTPLVNYLIIFGINWLEQHNPTID